MQRLSPLPNEVGTLTVNEVELIPKISVSHKGRFGDQSGIFSVVGIFDPNPFCFLFWVGIELTSV
jgi:hypothetical protein